MIKMPSKGATVASINWFLKELFEALSQQIFTMFLVIVTLLEYLKKYKR